MLNPTIHGLVIFLHDLFTVTWIGALVFMVLFLLPALRNVLGPGPQMLKLATEVQRRLSPFVYACMAGLLVTGLILAQQSGQFQGLFRAVDGYTTLMAIKHALVIVMVVVGLVRSRAVATGRWATRKGQKLGTGLLVLNLGLGVGVLLLSGLMAALQETV